MQTEQDDANKLTTAGACCRCLDWRQYHMQHIGVMGIYRPLALVTEATSLLLAMRLAAWLLSCTPAQTFADCRDSSCCMQGQA